VRPATRKLLGYAPLAIIVLVFVVFWYLSGDFEGAAKTTFMLLVVLGLFAAVILLVGGILFSIPGWVRTLRGISYDDHTRDLEKRGKARREHFSATRAMTAEDCTISGLTHFLDIGDGRILCLRGQQYYDFEPIEDDPEVNQDRQFPTRDFEVVFRVRNGEVLDLYPGSQVFEPKLFNPVVEPESLYELGIAFEDGEIVTGLSWEEVEKALAASGQKK
jgi:hypothetical protein